MRNKPASECETRIKRSKESAYDIIKYLKNIDNRCTPSTRYLAGDAEQYASIILQKLQDLECETTS